MRVPRVLGKKVRPGADLCVCERMRIVVLHAGWICVFASCLKRGVLCGSDLCRVCRVPGCFERGCRRAVSGKSRSGIVVVGVKSSECLCV